MLTPCAQEIAMALRVLRTCRRPRGLTLAQAGVVLGLTPDYLRHLEAGRAPLWPEVGHKVLRAYIRDERDRALVTLAVATVEATADWLRQQRDGRIGA